MKLKRKPIKPKLKPIYVKILVESYKNLEDLLSKLNNYTIEYKAISIRCDYYDTYLYFRDINKEQLIYRCNIDNYNRELEEYNQWTIDNKELIEQELERRKTNKANKTKNKINELLKLKNDIDTQIKELSNE